MHMSNDNNVRCPVCGGTTHVQRNLPPQITKLALEKLGNGPVPETLQIPHYQLRRCNQCTLEFANPPEPAGDSFYNWLNQNGNYYLGERWEWEQIAAVVQARSSSGACPTILEMGAGDGLLLRRLRDSFGARVVAIERSQEAAAMLRDSFGIEAHTEEEAAKSMTGQAFDFVLAFHCIEHVADPAGFLTEMCRWASTAGRVLFSVPYSPMYFEHFRFDPLNHPPHHMTRWNSRSLAALAAHVGGRADLTMPKALSTLMRAGYALAIYYLGVAWYRHPIRARILPILHPIHFLRELRIQARRERVNNRPAAEVVLVEVVRGQQ